MLSTNKKLEIISRLHRRFGSPARLEDSIFNTLKIGDIVVVYGHISLFHENKNLYSFSEGRIFEIIDRTQRSVLLYGDFFTKENISHARAHFKQCKLIEE